MDELKVVLALIGLIIVMLAMILMRQTEILSSMRSITGVKPEMSRDEQERFDARITALVRNGKKMDAVRLYRIQYGASLAEADAAVERMVQENH